MTTGVYLHKKTGKYAAQINRDGTRHYLGLHATVRAAMDARAAFAATLPQKNPPASPPSSDVLTQARLHELFDYDEVSGNLIWKARTSRRISVGDIAGYHTSQGYLAVRVDGRLYLAHRLIWMYLYGEFPVNEIDHRDGCGTNNRQANLRAATRAENAQNCKLRLDNALGVPGVYFNQRAGRYVARLEAFKSVRFTRAFVTIDQAASARAQAKARFHEFQPEQRGM